MLSVPSVVDTLLCRLKNNLSITLCMQVTQGGLYSVGVWVDVVLFGCSVASMAVKSLVCRFLPLRGKLSWVLVGSRVGSYHCIISFCALFFADGCVNSFVLNRGSRFPLPSRGATNSASRIPITRTKLLINSHNPLPPPSLPPFLQTCFSLETTGIGMGRGKD